MLGLFAVPKVSLAPVVIVWLGIYLAPKIVLSASLVPFHRLFQYCRRHRFGQSGNAGHAARDGCVAFEPPDETHFPHAAPYIFTAMRITAPGALIGAIIGEFLSANRGIGFFIAAASSRYDTARVFAGIVSLLVFVLLLNAAIARLEERRRALATSTRACGGPPMTSSCHRLRDDMVHAPGRTLMPNDSFQTIDTEVLIVGGGLAALRAALAARNAGARVLMLGKRLIGRSGSSTMTTGGYAAAVPNLNSGDSAELHYIDTIVGGGYVNERSLVRAFVDEAPARLRELWDYGVQFRKRNGHYHLSPSGDHTQARVFVPENMRGIDLTLPLRQAALDAGVDVLEDFMALDLLREDDRVVGAARAWPRQRRGGDHQREAHCACCWRRRAACSRSPAIRSMSAEAAMLWRYVPAHDLRDMEFIQFYPWRLIRPFKSTRVPIQPSTFMMGARLYNSRGERFMEKYDPIKKESAARDVSARGIADQIRQGLAVDGGVVLDVSDVPEDQFRYENSKVVDLLDPKKIDYRQIQLVVAPEAHFFMGGVAIDDCGRASLRGPLRRRRECGRRAWRQSPQQQLHTRNAGVRSSRRIDGCAGSGRGTAGAR